MKLARAPRWVALALLWPASALAVSHNDAHWAELMQSALRSVQGGARVIRATQETGPNDPRLTVQSALIEAVREARPATVMIMVEEGPRQFRRPLLCAGVIVSDRHLPRPGLVVTNAHCVGEKTAGDEAAIALLGVNGRPVPASARVLAVGSAAHAKDLALLEISDPLLRRPGRPLWYQVEPGEQVFAVGNPHGFGFSISAGIVSGVGRDTITGQYVHGMTQTDAALNKGNSGGPLFNLWGSVVGINSMLVTPTGASSGVGFAIPADFVRRALMQYARTGNLRPGALRVRATAGPAGVMISEVYPGGPGQAAGLRSGDVIEGASSQDIHVVRGEDPEDTLGELAAAVKYMSPGERLSLNVRRGGALSSMQAVIGEAPSPAGGKTRLPGPGATSPIDDSVSAGLTL